VSATTASDFDPVPADRAAVLDPRWLEQALDLVDDGDRVVAVEEVGSSKTVADKLRFVVTIEGPSGTRTHPLCAKAHFGDGINSLLGEASFYRHLQPWLGVRSPSAHHTGVDPATNRGLIVMDDIIALGGTIGDAHAPYPVDVCRDALGQLALLHARTWGDDRWDRSWLAPRVATMASMFPTGHLQELLDDGRGPDLPPVLRDASVLVAAMERTAELPPTCVLHADTHSGNCYLDSDGRACWFDWQIVQRGHWSVDVAYHLGTVLTVEDRRAHEVELLEHYLGELEAHGVPAPAFDEAWERYALGFTWGYFLWVITRISSREVVLLHVPRLGAALTDHDTFARLGV
jgi:Phosphotransferase enzyme family